MTAQVAVASKEQSEGITEINKAMGYIDQSTQENTSMANSTSVNAQSLNDQAKTLNKNVDGLLTIVNGGKKAAFDSDSFEKTFEKVDTYDTSQEQIISFEDDELPEDDFIETPKSNFKEEKKIVEIKAKETPKPSTQSDEVISASSVIPDRDDDRFEDVG